MIVTVQTTHKRRVQEEKARGLTAHHRDMDDETRVGKGKQQMKQEKTEKDTFPCIGFSMKDPVDAYRHMKLKRVRDYGDVCGDHYLHTWDDGRRLLMRCRNCGGYVLVQLSEFHGFGMEDSDYNDYFPVSGPEEAQKINEQYDGYRIEREFPKRWLSVDSPQHPHWQ